ncbi:MAG: fumarylacetoacetate hydrolase [Alphaproteobacteria bacterium]|nr:fumarylacetoacetate hydrolase [Alphaproteobacteria bacterium]
MARLVSFEVEGRRRPGALKGDRVMDLAAAGMPAGEHGDLMAIARGGDDLRRQMNAEIAAWSAPVYALGDVTLRAPIHRPEKIIGIGLNYIDHCKEAGLPVPDLPVVFTKHSNTSAGPYDDVCWHADVTSQVDYEVELGVVIGRPASRVAEADALDYVLGYAAVNDVSARDLQLRPPGQWDLGKSLDGFCPWGPAIVTADEAPDPQTLDISLKVNGKTRQSSNTKNMVFGVACLISYLSRVMTLSPGDLIATGTPFGVILGMNPKVWLKDGDVCETEVAGIGTLRNRMRMIG